jgi:hypothetical protein
MNRFILRMGAAGACIAAMTAPALAGTVTLTLTHTNLTNVTDAAGLTQYETGTVARGSTAAGQYEVTRRVSTGATEAQNTASTRITLYLAATTIGGAPQNIIMEGSYSYNNGGFIGQVTAASSRYAFMRDADAVGAVANSGETLTITFPGVFPFAFP